MQRRGVNRWLRPLSASKNMPNRHLLANRCAYDQKQTDLAIQPVDESGAV
jgi:hypothetical protein